MMVKQVAFTFAVVNCHVMWHPIELLRCTPITDLNARALLIVTSNLLTSPTPSTALLKGDGHGGCVSKELFWYSVRGWLT